MSQAEDLLNNISSNDITLYTAEPATEGHIVIDKDRNVTVPEPLKRIAVQYDKNIETVTFDCPRYWDNNDLSTMNIYINYQRPDTVMGLSLAKNVRVDEADPNIIHFEWLITHEIAMVNGNMKFSVSAKKTEDSEDVKRWYSEICDQMFISKGLDASEYVASEYPDVMPDIINEAITKMQEINDTYDEKMEAFNTNAEEKTTEFNNNAVDKIDDVNAVADGKIDEYNDNVTAKLEEFDTYAENKVDEYDQNAANKVNDFNNTVDDIQNEIDDLYNNQLPPITLEDKSIHVEDSAKMRAKVGVKGDMSQHTEDPVAWKEAEGNSLSLSDITLTETKNAKLEGNIEQDSYEGNQLVDFNNPSAIGKNDFTFENDVLYIKQNEASNYSKIYYDITEFYKNNANKILFFTRESYDYSKAEAGRVQLEITNNDNTKTYVGLGEPHTIPADTSSIQKVLFAIYNNNSATITDTSEVTIVKPMLSFTENATYEPYVGGQASPNPDYPQDIRVVDGEQKVKIGNKNLFDKNNITIGVYTENEFDTNRTDYRSTKPILSGPNKSYTLTTETSQWTVIAFLDKNLNMFDRHGTTTAEHHVVTPEGTSYIAVSVLQSKFSENIQFEENTVATDYVEHQSQELPVLLSSDNIADLSTMKKSADGLNITVSEDGLVAFSGAATKNYISLLAAISIDDILEDGQTYTVWQEKHVSDGNYIYSQISVTSKDNGSIGHLTSEYNNNSITIDKSKYTYKYMIQTGGNSIDITINETNRFMLYKGTEEKPYQPFYTQQTELAGNETARDYIYKRGNKWFKKNNLRKVILDGTENWTYYNESKVFYTDGYPLSAVGADYSNYYIFGNWSSTNNSVNVQTSSNGARVHIRDDRFANVTDFKAWLAEQYANGTPVIVWYQLETPTDTELTEPYLIDQLNALYNMSTYLGITHVDIDGLGLIKFNYDGYDGTPSPAHPSEIEVVTGDVEVRVGNKNLFKVDNYTKNNNYGLNYVIENNLISIKGTTPLQNWPSLTMYADGSSNSKQFYANSTDIKKKRGFFNSKDCFVSIEAEGTISNDTYTIVIGFENEILQRTSKIQNKFIVDITGKKINFINIGISQNIKVDAIFKVQIEQGKIATDHIEHQSQSLPLTLGSVELCGKSGSRDSLVYDSSSDKLYKRAKWGKFYMKDLTFVRNGTNVADKYRFYTSAFTNNIKKAINNDSIVGIYATFEKEYTVNQGFLTSKNCISIDTAGYIFIYDDLFAEITATEFNNYFADSDDYVIFPLAQTTLEEIPDLTLKEQVKALLRAMTYEGVTNVNSDNDLMILTLEYYQSLSIVISNQQKEIDELRELINNITVTN